MAADLTDARRWTRDGTTLLLAYVAANAEALGNLVRWAATGEPTPMYASPEDRAAGIERGVLLPADDLNAWLGRSARALDDAMTALSDEQWQAPVVTAQGRTVPATEVPWLRAREVFVHGVDLATGLSFAELPAGFRTALCDEVVTKRAASQAQGPALLPEAADTAGRWELSGAGDTVTLSGSLAEITAYLTGRAHRLTTAGGDPAPALGPWL
jgi:uncharacterized protein (TIGR03083 family)